MGASSEFLRISASAETSIPLPRRFVLNAGVIGQWSDDSLPISQRCGYGTNAYARGFDRSYVNGDRCLGGRTELAYNIELPDLTSEKFNYTQGYVGIDFGWVQDNPTFAMPRLIDTWSSGSLGVRTLRGDFIGEVSVTQIFDQPTGATEQQQTRFWLRGAARF